MSNVLNHLYGFCFVLPTKFIKNNDNKLQIYNSNINI